MDVGWQRDGLALRIRAAAGQVSAVGERSQHNVAGRTQRGCAAENNLIEPTAGRGGAGAVVGNGPAHLDAETTDPGRGRGHHGREIGVEPQHSRHIDG